MGDENCVGGGGCKRSSYPPTVLIPQLTVNVGGGLVSGGWAYHAPTPQAGRVTDSHGREGSTMPYMDLERVTFYIDYQAFKQWH